MRRTINHMMLVSAISFSLSGCSGEPPVTSEKKFRLVTVDPGHFHAALVQKEMYPQIDSTAYTYAPEGAEVEAYLDLIKLYNERPDSPTSWNQQVYKGPDFFDRMLSEKKGNVVVLAGNNQHKTGYINRSVLAGLNVLADKPMAIDTGDFALLRSTFSEAEEKGLLLYDIMTERSEITNVIQKELSHMPGVFGELKDGTPDDPSVVLESIHYFFKQVSGKPLRRPAWFFDPQQEGEALADVGTHLVDMVQWQCFPEEIIDYEKDIDILFARLWPTPLNSQQFANITGINTFPEYLQPYVSKDSVLQTHANGEMTYRIKGKHVKVIARWDYQAAEGGDTHYALLKGSKADLVIRQGREEKFKPVLYIIPSSGNQDKEYANTLAENISRLSEKYPGVEAVPYQNGWRVVIPEKYDVGHEAHFAEVTERYLEYLEKGNMPAWEVPNMIAKYYTTTKAVQVAKKEFNNN